MSGTSEQPPAPTGDVALPGLADAVSPGLPSMQDVGDVEGHLREQFGAMADVAQGVADGALTPEAANARVRALRAGLKAWASGEAPGWHVTPWQTSPEGLGTAIRTALAGDVADDLFDLEGTGGAFAVWFLGSALDILRLPAAEEAEAKARADLLMERAVAAMIGASIAGPGDDDDTAGGAL